jgi:uroporphyrinogen decarboxylase
MKPLLIRHLEGQSIGRLPVWMMRQAGRYLPEYRAIRQKHGFWEMITTPELAVEVSLQPLSAVGVDAVIFFSDILTLPYGMGISIEMKEAIGPVVLNPFRDQKEFSRFLAFAPQMHVPFVGKALREIRRRAPEEKAVIGFAGAPWTVTAYLVEGRGKTDFAKTKQWLEDDTSNALKSLEQLGHATIEYLKYQVESGVDIVQLFDTWLSRMSPAFFSQYYVPLLNEIFTEIKKSKIPVIYFAKDIANYLPCFPQLKCDVISVGNDMNLDEVDRFLDGKFSLQGNLDPEILLTTEADVRAATRRMVQKARGLRRPAIANLGHGILPSTPVANAQAFVQEAKALWV